MVEEFFFRGYLMGRFCKWLGDIKGLLLNAVNFSLTHIIFLFSRYGLTYVRGELIIGFQTFMGGASVDLRLPESERHHPGIDISPSICTCQGRDERGC